MAYLHHSSFCVLFLIFNLQFFLLTSSHFRSPLTQILSFSTHIYMSVLSKYVVLLLCICLRHQLFKKNANICSSMRIQVLSCSVRLQSQAPWAAVAKIRDLDECRNIYKIIKSCLFFFDEYISLLLRINLNYLSKQEVH